MLLLILMFAVGAADEGASSSLSGYARVITADTLEISGAKFKLDGIDAPDVLQGCEDAQGYFYRCGLEAWKFTNSLTAGRVVSCVETQRLKGFGKGPCAIDGKNMALLILENGHAVALDGRREFAAAEATAREKKRGLWAGSFIRPDTWRKRAKTEPPIALTKR